MAGGGRRLVRAADRREARVGQAGVRVLADQGAAAQRHRRCVVARRAAWARVFRLTLLGVRRVRARELRAPGRAKGWARVVRRARVKLRARGATRLGRLDAVAGEPPGTGAGVLGGAGGAVASTGVVSSTKQAAPGTGVRSRYPKIYSANSSAHLEMTGNASKQNSTFPCKFNL